MYKKILVPIDGSKFAECVLDHVRYFSAGCNSAEVILLFVLEPISGGISELPLDWMDEAKKRGLDFANNYLNEISGELQKSGINITKVVTQGNPSESVLSYAQSNGIDLIILSTHGRSGIARWALGSVADKVIHHSSVPILIVTPPGCRLPAS